MAHRRAAIRVQQEDDIMTSRTFPFAVLPKAKVTP